MEWINKGDSRKPVARFGVETMIEYYNEMERENVNWQVVTIAIPKIACIQGLGNVHKECDYNGPNFRVFNEVDKVDGENKVTVYDVEVFCFLCELIKQDKEKMDIQIRLNANVIAMLREEGLL